MGAHRKNPPANAAADIERLAAQGFANIGIAMHFKVSKDTLKRWLDDYPELEEAFEQGREVERQRLHAAVYAAAMAGKGANVNAFFLLKARFGYVEADQRSVNVNVGVAVAQNVLVVKDHGTDAEWAAKAAEQQRRITMPETAPRQLQAPHLVSQPSRLVPECLPTPEPAATPPTPAYGPPVWMRKA